MQVESYIYNKKYIDIVIKYFKINTWKPAKKQFLKDYF